MTWRTAFAVFATLLSLFALFGFDGRLRLELDSSTGALGGQEDPKTTERVIVSIEPEGALGLEHIALVDQISRELINIPGVVALHSLANAEIPHATGDDIDLTPLKLRINRDPDDARVWLERSLRDPLVRGRLASNDGRATAIIVEVDARDEMQSRQTALQVRELVRLRLKDRQDLDWLVTGAPLISHAIGDLLVRELVIVLPTAIFFCALILWMAFRRATVVGACLVTVATAVLWTLAAAVALGWKLNLVTILIPPLVTTLSVAYTMHVISAFGDKGDLAAGLAVVRLPLVITALTTMVGLAALAVNNLESIRQFAVLGAIGTAAAALAADTVLPMMLQWIRKPPDLWPAVNSRLMVWARRIANMAIDHSQIVVRVGIGIFVLGLIGASQVESGARYVRDLDREHPERMAYEKLNLQYGGANRFAIDILASGQDAILAPQVLMAIDDMQTWLRAQPDIGTVQSLPDYVKRIHQTFSGGDPADHIIPVDASVSKQLLVIAAPDEIYDYTNLEFSRLSIEVTTPLIDSGALRNLFTRIQNQFKTLPAGLEVQLSGNAVRLTRTVDELTGGQLRSILIAAAAILLVLSVLFASIRVGMRAMLPNLLPISIYFGILGFTGTPLGPTTALVACIVLGIAVDDTLHLLVRFNDLARKYADEERATREAVAEIIRPVTLTTIAVSSGFLVLATSPFQSQVVFGVLAAVTLVAAWFCDLILTPAVSARASVVTLWDVVRLDLGTDPQKTIPLMEDMSPRQARVLALSAKIITVKPGEDLIRQGESGSEMFVVIDGEFKIFIKRRDGESVALAVRGRGTTIGEGGYFNQRRTANVTAVSPARVMVFDSESLERLRKRNARIGALVYRNLNRIQAERIAGHTEQIATSTGRWDEEDFA